MLTFEQRVSKITCLEDHSAQISKANRCIKGLRAKSKNATTLEEKTVLLREQRVAEQVFTDLRLAYFIIEDGLDEGLLGNELAQWVRVELKKSRSAKRAA